MSLPGWLVVHADRPGETHVIPIDDLIEHEDEDCVCGPLAEFAVCPDHDACSWFLYTHRALDGRE